MKDPLDHKIDALLKSYPLRPNKKFTVRVLEAAEQDLSAETKRPIKKIVFTAMPIAAAIMLAFNLLLPNNGNRLKTPEMQGLSIAEADEIFFLEKNLRTFFITKETSFAGQDLLATLDALYLEI